MTPKSYAFKFIEPGIISYADTNQGVVLVSREALDRMAPTFLGCPIIFVPEKHNATDKDNAFNFEDIGANTPAGIISGKPYWKEDGFQWADGLVWDEDAQAALDQAGVDVAAGKDPSWSCSCAYDPEEDPIGGVWHELEYDAEVVNGKYKHMAIVPRGRYEGARVLANSKGGPSVALFGFGKKNAEPAGPAVKPAPAVPEKKPEEGKPEMLNDDATVDVNGTPVPLYELIEKYQMSKGSGNVPQALTPEDEVSLPDGSTVKISELIAVYGAGEGSEAPMQNAEEPQDVKAELPVDPARQVRANAAPAKPKVNQALKNAVAKGGDPGQIGGIDSEITRLDRGKARYSIPVKQGGK